MPITVQTLVHAPIESVWRAYTTPDDIRQWNAASPDWHTTAARVDLRRYRKSQRGPKKTAPKRVHDPKRPHVSVARLLAQRGQVASP